MAILLEHVDEAHKGDQEKKSDHSKEDIPLFAGATWYGSAIGWNKIIDPYIRKLSSVCERFCGVKYSDSIKLMNISAYLPTSGRDDEYIDVIDQLSVLLRITLKQKKL